MRVTPIDQNTHHATLQSIKAHTMWRYNTYTHTGRGNDNKANAKYWGNYLQPILRQSGFNILWHVSSYELIQPHKQFSYKVMIQHPQDTGTYVHLLNGRLGHSRTHLRRSKLIMSKQKCLLIDNKKHKKTNLNDTHNHDQFTYLYTVNRSNNTIDALLVVDSSSHSIVASWVCCEFDSVDWSIDSLVVQRRHTYYI